MAEKPPSTNITPITSLSVHAERKKLAETRLPEQLLDAYDRGQIPTIPAVQEAASLAAKRLQPVSVKRLVQLIDRYFAIYSPPASGWDKAADVYLEALAELPELLAEQTFMSVVRSHVFPTAPTPADVLKAAPDSWHRWRAENARLRGMTAHLEARAKAEAQAEKRRADLAAQSQQRLAAFNAGNVEPLARAGESLGRAAERATISRQALAELAARPKIPVPALGGKPADAETAEPSDHGAEASEEGES